MPNELNIVNMIIEFEEGTLDFEDTIKLFSELIRTGQAWQLQGFYGRTARDIIEMGFIDENGKVNEIMVNNYKHQEF